MSFRFDSSEVPQFLPELVEVKKRTGVSRNGKPVAIGTGACVACGDWGDRDLSTGLCRPCWRVVILGPAMENK